MGPITFNRIAPQLHELGRMLPTSLSGPQAGRLRTSLVDEMTTQSGAGRLASSMLRTRDIHASTAFDIISSNWFEQQHQNSGDTPRATPYARGQSDLPLCLEEDNRESGLRSGKCSITGSPPQGTGITKIIPRLISRVLSGRVSVKYVANECDSVRNFSI